jgi:hypothetical protein
MCTASPSPDLHGFGFHSSLAGRLASLIKVKEKQKNAF